MKITNRQQEISNPLDALQARMKTGPAVTVVFFEADARKSGGEYRAITGSAKKIDEYLGMLELIGGTTLPFDDILSLEDAHGDELVIV